MGREQRVTADRAEETEEASCGHRIESGPQGGEEREVTWDQSRTTDAKLSPNIS